MLTEVDATFTGKPIWMRTFEKFGLKVWIKPPLPKWRINSFHFIPRQEVGSSVIWPSRSQPWALPACFQRHHHPLKFQHISMYAGQKFPLSPRLLRIKVKNSPDTVRASCNDYLPTVLRCLSEQLNPFGVWFQHSPPFLPDFLFQRSTGKWDTFHQPYARAFHRGLRMWSVIKANTWSRTTSSLFPGMQ